MLLFCPEVQDSSFIVTLSKSFMIERMLYTSKKSSEKNDLLIMDLILHLKSNQQKEKLIHFFNEAIKTFDLISSICSSFHFKFTSNLKFSQNKNPLKRRDFATSNPSDMLIFRNADKREFGHELLTGQFIELILNAQNSKP